MISQIATFGHCRDLLQDSGAVPVADKQGEFDVEAVPVDGTTTSGDRPTDAILHRVEVQVQFLGGQLVARTTAKDDPQRLAQPPVGLVVGREITEHLVHPSPDPAEVSTQHRGNGQTGVSGGGDRALVLPAGDSYRVGTQRLMVRPAEPLDTDGRRANSDAGRIRPLQRELSHPGDHIGRRCTVRQPTLCADPVGGDEGDTSQLFPGDNDRRSFVASRLLARRGRFLLLTPIHNASPEE